MLENDDVNDLKKIKKIFAFIYWGLLIAGALCLILYINKTNTSTHADKTYLYLAIACLMLDFIAMFANNVKLGCSKNQLILSALFFLPNAVFAFLYLFVPLYTILSIVFIYNICVGIFSLIVYMYCRTKAPDTPDTLYDNKITIVSLLSIVLMVFAMMGHTYFDSAKIYIVAGIIAGAVFLLYTILTLTVFRNIYTKWLIKKSQRFGAFACALLLTFVVALPMLDIINTTGQKIISQNEYVIVDKSVSSGKYGNKTYYLITKIDNKDIWLKVSSKTYDSKNISDSIKLDTYKGNLNWKYYDYVEEDEKAPESR